MTRPSIEEKIDAIETALDQARDGIYGTKSPTHSATTVLQAFTAKNHFPFFSKSHLTLCANRTKLMMSVELNARQNGDRK